MDFDAEIDRELEELSSCESEEYEEVDDTALVPSGNIVQDDVDWLKLFVEKTSELSRKSEIVLCDAEVVLKEIDTNVTESRIRKSTLKDLTCVLDEDKVEQNVDAVERIEPEETRLTDQHDIEEDVAGGNSPSQELESEHDDYDVIVKEDEGKIEDFIEHKNEADKRILEFESSCNMEITNQLDDLEAQRLDAERHLMEMERAEREIFLELSRQKSFYEEERNRSAACRIQAFYRGYLARREYGEVVDKKICEMKERRHQERIEFLEQKRKQNINNHKLPENEENNNVKDVDFKVTENQTVVPDMPSINDEVELENVVKCNRIENNLDNNLASEIDEIEENLSDNSGFTQNDGQAAIHITTSVTESVSETETPQSQKSSQTFKSNTLSEIKKDLEILEQNEQLNCETVKRNAENLCEVFDKHGKQVLHTSNNRYNAINEDIALLEASVHFNKEKLKESSAPCGKSGCDVKEQDLVTKETSSSLLPVISTHACNEPDDVVELCSETEEVVVPKKLKLSSSDFCQPDRNILDNTEQQSSPDAFTDTSQLDNKLFSDNNTKNVAQSGLHETSNISDQSENVVDIPHSTESSESTTSYVSTVGRCASETGMSGSDELSPEHFPSPSPPPSLNAGCHANVNNISVTEENVLPKCGFEIEECADLDETSLNKAEVLNNTEVTSQCVLTDTVLAISDVSCSEQLLSISAHQQPLKTPIEKEPTSLKDHIEHACDNDATDAISKNDEIKLDHLVESTQARSLEKKTVNVPETEKTSPTDSNDSTLVGTNQKNTTADKNADMCDQNIKKCDENHKMKTCDIVTSVTNSWQKWRSSCVSWEMSKPESAAKSSLRRATRRSSAAKKLPPLSEEDILNGRWPHFKELADDRRVETLTRVHVFEAGGNGHNLIHVHRCAHLTHLTLVRCGLVSLEGLQACHSLRHINVSHNEISVISCDGMKRLESLVAIGNRLTSIHGLSGCHELMILDLSRNNITRTTGMEGLTSLHHLRLAHNQLMNLNGLASVNSLITLDVSHNNLSTLDGIGECGLIRSIEASFNCFTEIPARSLSNAVLLVQLNLSSNNIPTLQLSNDVWLPSLACLDLRGNKISLDDFEFLPSIEMPQLHSLNLSHNLISSAEKLMSELAKSASFKELELSENLFSKQQEIEIYDATRSLEYNVLFSDLNNENLSMRETPTDLISSTLLVKHFYREQPSNKLRPPVDLFHQVLTEQLEEYFELASAEVAELKSLRGWRSGKRRSNENSPEVMILPPDLFACHCDYLRRNFEMAIKHRYVHESTTIKSHKAYESESVILENKMSTPQKAETKHLSPPALDSEDKQHSSRVSLDDDMPEPDTLMHKQENQTFSLGNPNKHKNTSSTNSRIVYERMQQLSNSSAMEKIAAVKIQAWWKKCVAVQKYRNLVNYRNHAAMLIQALWRGHVVRKKIKQAFLSFDNSKEFETEDFEEVDISQLHFDENLYDEQWAFRTDIIPERSLQASKAVGTPSGHMKRPLSRASLRESNQHYTEIGNSHELWKTVSSFSKPPLPPITPTGSTTSEYQQVISDDRNQSPLLLSHRSNKEEQLTNEWGFHSSSVTELMLKRARRMKGRRKKEVNADEKLRRFKDMSQRAAKQPLMTQQKPVHSRNRMEYFKAREMAFEEKDKKPSEDDERRRQFTYEWLHTKANYPGEEPTGSRGGHGPSHTKNRPISDGESMRSGFLPVITKQRSLVSPQHNDMEVLSLSSCSSAGSRSKHLLRDIARRHTGYHGHVAAEPRR